MKRVVATGCVAVGAVLAVVGVLVAVLAGGSSSGSSVAAGTAPVVDVGRVPSDAIGTARSRDVGLDDRRGIVPSGSRLRLPGQHVDARIVAVRVRAGVMQIPRDPRKVGWWRGGRAPGDRRGSAVLVGPVNYAGTTGALAGLGRLRPGGRVVLTEPHRTLRYRVVAVRTYPKTRGIPASVFAPAGRPRLVLITCGGPFDPSTGNYLDNIVAYAVPQT